MSRTSLAAFQSSPEAPSLFGAHALRFARNLQKRARYTARYLAAKADDTRTK